MDWVKAMLVRAGRLANQSLIHNANAVLNYLEAGRWARENGYNGRDYVSGRDALFDLLALRLGEQRVCYLEFGVYRGRGVQFWSDHLKHPEARIHGFDSFEGLPVGWNHHFGRGAFDLGGRVPQIDDPRVTFHKGWFSDTLPGFVPPEHDVLLVTLDADLYASTKVVFDHLQQYFDIGTLLYFDEWCDRFHEKRAFEEYLAETGHRYRLVVADRTLSTVLFERIA